MVHRKEWHQIVTYLLAQKWLSLFLEMDSEATRQVIDECVIVPHNQCDQSWRFFALWATF